MDLIVNSASFHNTQMGWEPSSDGASEVFFASFTDTNKVMRTVFSRQLILRSSRFQCLASWVEITMKICLLELTIGPNECDWGIAAFVTSVFPLLQPLSNSADEFITSVWTLHFNTLPYHSLSSVFLT